MREATVSKIVEINPFPVAPDDPLAKEHAAVVAWVEEAFGSLDEHLYYRDVELKNHATGKRLLEAKPEQARRYVVAAVAQLRHWDAETDKIRAQAETDSQRWNPHHLPGWAPVWGRRRQAAAVLTALMRRALPLQRSDLLDILQWCAPASALSTYFAPVGAITRALERYAASTPLDDEFRGGMKRFAFLLRESHDKDAKRLGTTVEQLCADDLRPQVETGRAMPAQAAPTPSPAGSAHVLDALKRFFGMVANSDAPATATIGPDQFPMIADSPLQLEHRMLTALFEELVGTHHYHHPTLANFTSGQAILAADARAMAKMLLAAAERHVNALFPHSIDYTDHRFWQSRYSASGVVAPLLETEFELDRGGFFDLLLYFAAIRLPIRSGRQVSTERLVERAETEAATSPLTEGERYVLWLFRASLLTGPALGAPSAEVSRLSCLINDGAMFYLAPGEAWSDAVNTDLTRLAPGKRQDWAALFKHALTATSARPSAKWLAAGGKLVQAVGAEDVEQAFVRWLPLVTQGQSIPRLGVYSGDTRGVGDVMNEENATCLRGLLWLVQTLPRPHELAREVAAAALSAYKKVPGVGPRAVKVGNAAVYALSELKSAEAVGQLAMLKVRIKFGTAQKEIEKAFTTAAGALGLPRDQIEEMGVPSYGMEEVGTRSESLGDYRADLIVTGSDAQIRWSDSKGKTLKSVPAKVKSDHKDELKELQQALKDIQSMLPAQRDRLDSMFLLQKRWRFDEWRERYLDHPLVGTIARRLIWRMDEVPLLFLDGKPTDVRGAPVALPHSAQIALWHPVECPLDEIIAWRRRIEELGVTQPFKQAHREVYVLTDAERNTATYSNRFAAHILRQHQFNALCAARGWKNRLRLMVDDTYPPASKTLPQWGLRAEFWIEGIGDAYGTDTNESGVYLRLATDQVRFYRVSAAENTAHAGGGGYSSAAAGPGEANVNEPLALDQIPALVFSEIMRDVDLFVGVASVGNDPTWQDGGPEGRYRAYWQSYSFGELSGTATTRKQVLEGLVPRLKIADRCSFADRFLVVRGKIRTYKIHLGSGNILMEPNDEYLCIVPDARTRGAGTDLFLPFEGDATLSIIISKAFLLADDTKITDPTITRQIKRP
jgi:hypothetical protein